MLPRVSLCTLPTPCHRLDRLSEKLGIDLWMKRDDLTGFALGGNKGRKLEFLMAEALAQGADAVVTCGAAQSNFVRQLAAACRVLGLECHAALMNFPYAAAHGRPTPRDNSGGNLVLGRFFECKVYIYPDNDWELLYEYAEAVARRLEDDGKRVYRIPVGGSSGLGAYSFVQAHTEISESFDWIIAPCSSGSTHIGLAHGALGSAAKVVGIACDPEPEIMEDLVRISGEVNEVMATDKHPVIDFRLNWAGEAYGIPSPEGDAAMRLLADTEGILLDPIYGAKAFSGLLALVESGEVRGKVLFWHTGGAPTLFAGKGIA